MIKDIIINLEHQVARDPAHDFAISIAETFGTHIAGVAFAYTPDFPGYTMMVLPSDILEQMVAESESRRLPPPELGRSSPKVSSVGTALTAASRSVGCTACPVS